jgi:aryl-alcohol dehydrogenase-like predicted oxidoreductase
LVTAVGISNLSCDTSVPAAQQGYDAKGLPTRVLGKTGVAVPLIALGCGSRFCSVTNPDEGIAILNHALESGIYYWDTGHSYVYHDVVSEERLGLVLRDRREEVFLATKIGDRTRDGALRQVEESIGRLQTDHLDLLQIHNVQTLEDVDVIGAAGGVVEAVNQLKDEGATRFIGFTGHSSAEALAEMARRFEFDTVLFALNHQSAGEEDREGLVVAEAVKKDMGILVMKVIRPRESLDTVTPQELMRYALSLDHVTAAVIGTDGLDLVTRNVELARTFEPMDAQEMDRIAGTLKPLFDSGRLAWMQPGYTDGVRI